MRLARNIVLIGFMGTGKSALGRALAHCLGIGFLDTDHRIESLAGKAIPVIFSEEGEAAFRARETALLEHLAASDRTGSRAEPLVIACGGGMPLREENVALLKQIGQIIWLTAPPEQILRRVGPDLSLRPLLAACQDDPLARIASLLAVREPHYASAADLIWDTSCHDTPEEAAAALTQQLCLPAASHRPKPPVTA